MVTTCPAAAEGSRVLPPARSLPAWPISARLHDGAASLFAGGSCIFIKTAMPTCDCCHIVIRPDDPEAMSIAIGSRVIRLCHDHARLIVAMLADFQIEPPIEVIR